MPKPTEVILLHVVEVAKHRTVAKEHQHGAVDHMSRVTRHRVARLQQHCPVAGGSVKLPQFICHLPIPHTSVQVQLALQPQEKE